MSIPVQHQTKPIRQTEDLLSSERELLKVLGSLGFGRIERIPVRDGHLYWEDNAGIVKILKLGSLTSRSEQPEEFALKSCVVELFTKLRAVKSGMIRVLEVRHGLPFTLEFEEELQERQKQPELV